MEKTIDGKELGLIYIRKNLRARHYSLRIIEGKIIATIPKRGSESGVLSLIDANRERLRRMLAKSTKRPVLDEDCRMKTCTFELHIFRTQRNNIYISLKDGILHIACPEDTDFDTEQIQQKLWAVVTKVMRIEAIRVLSGRLAKLAAQHGFQYAGVTVRNSRSRWGSCSAKKRINLSSSLMLLPDHLIDYVLLHELCHTVELNHSERFWALLDKVTTGNAHKLRKELKATRMEINS